MNFSIPEKASIVILTGAGISAESGLETFRGAGGLWCGHRVEDVATPEAFARNPAMVHEFYNMRRRGLLKPEINPNPAHLALAELEQKWPGEVLVVTQNIDDLHERAGTKNLIHMHGEVLKAFCHFCRSNIECRNDLSIEMTCAKCSKTGGIRPDIVWFGEMPYRMDEIFDALANCDLFLSIGTSGNVYPAAGFVSEALRHDAFTAELNLEPSLNASIFHESLTGPATETVVRFVNNLLK
ncbi:MAG: NAD-dependent deacylase [Alphaproteobacteria bacterium PRO2]|nr:NAD-dependent deacylase [Alphaproteobacteria bacterium PRO2]